MTLPEAEAALLPTMRDGLRVSYGGLSLKESPVGLFVGWGCEWHGRRLITRLDRATGNPSVSSTTSTALRSIIFRISFRTPPVRFTPFNPLILCLCGHARAVVFVIVFPDDTDTREIDGHISR